MESMAASSNKMKEKIVFVAQQLHFANALAGNDSKQRARAIKKLRNFFVARSSGNFCFTRDDFMRLWKGLFYCMWMSDKPLIQEELAEEISQLIHCFGQVDTILKFIQTYFDTLITEWYGIDYHRMDKFQMFLRRFLRQSLVFCKNYNWENKSVRGLCSTFESTVLSPSKCEDLTDKSLILHFVDIFVEELSKVSAGEMPKEVLLEFLKPFASNLVEQLDFRVQGIIRERIFFNLIRQSPEGMEYEEKFEAWKRAGFPGESWKDMVFVGKNDNRPGVKIKNLDPRAGKVNVYLPRLQFDTESVAEMIMKYSEKSSNSQRRNYLVKISKKFQMLAKGEYPFAMNISKLVRESRKQIFTKDFFDDAVEDFLNFNTKLEKNDEIFGGKRKKKPRKSKKSKKMKLEKNVRKRNYENDGSEELSSEESGDENSSSEIESEDENSSSEIESRDKNSSSNIDSRVVGGKKMNTKKNGLNKKTQTNNVHSLNSTQMKKKVKDTVASSMSEIPNLDEENSHVDKLLKEDKVKSKIDKDNLQSESTFLSESIQGKVDQAQIAESMEIVQKGKEMIKLNEKKEDSCQKSETSHSTQENGNLEFGKEKLENSSPDLGIHSPENGDTDIIQNREEEESIVTEVEIPLSLETATALRRSVRRRSSVIPETTPRIGGGKGDKGFSVNSSTPKSVKKTPLLSVRKTPSQSVKKTPSQSVKSKKRVGKAFSPIEVEWEVEEQSQPSVQSETPMTKGKSTLRPAMVAEQQMEKQEDPANVSVPEFFSSEKELTVSDGDTVNQKSKLTPQRINLRSVRRQSLSKKRASLNSTPLSSKRVNIDLQMNCSQDFEEYIQTVSRSPTVPHDVNKKPCKGVLKQTSIKSPLNPFYRPPKGIWSVLPTNFK